MRFRLMALATVTAIAALASTFGLEPGAGGSASAQTDEAEQTGNVVVKFKPATSLGEVAQAITDAEGEAIDSTGPSGLVLVEPDPGQSVADAVAELSANGDVEFAEADVLLHASVVPNDPLYASYGWPAPMIGLPTAWNTTTGSASVIVAVIDTGVDGAHPDLSGKITTGVNAGYNFVSNTTNTTDDQSHGTFVASIIAANTNNGVGMYGVCWTCKIMPIKVLDSAGSGSSFNVSQGIDWAVSHGAKVANLSLGGGGTAGLQTSVDNAWNAGVIVVAASGNDNGPVLWPAAYANAIAVGSIDSTGLRSSFSNFGPELDIMAPGGNVLGALCTCAAYTGGYGTGSGTSFAAPHISGVVGLLIASGVTDKNQIRSRLLTTATNMDAAGFDNNTGWGRVNASAAISAQYSTSWSAGNTLPTTMAAGGSTSALVTLSNTGSMTWPAGGGNPVRFSYHWHSGTCAANNAISIYGVRTALPADVSSGASVTNLSATIQAPPTAGTYCLQYDLVHELVTWFSWQGASVQSQTVTVSAPTYGVNWGTNTLPTTMSAGSGQSVTATFTNTGSLTWASGGPNPVRFGYHWHTGTCAAGNPISIYGVRTSLAADVAPGGAVTSLDASVQAPPTAGTYCLQYDLVRELVTWFSWQGATVQSQTVTVGAPLYSASWGANTLPTTLVAGDTTTSAASFTNSGSLNWQAGGANPVRFSYHWHAGTCAAGNAASIYGVRTLLPGDVAANGTVNNLSVSIQAPPTSGTYCLKYDLVRELVTWFSWQGAATQEQTVTVTPAYAVTWGANTLPTTLVAGDTTTTAASFTNSGGLTWAAGGGTPVRFSYHWHAGTCAAGNAASIYGVRTLLPGDVAANGTVNNLSVSIQAPPTSGTYCLKYDLVRELVTWFSWQGAATQEQTVTVTPAYAVTWGANTLPTTLSAGATTQHLVTFTNNGLTWPATGGTPVRFSYHWHAGTCAAGSGVIAWGERTLLPGDVATGGTVTGLSATILAPGAPGTYCLQYDMVRELVTWFSWQGANVQSQTVTVNP